ncbi:N-6 DNA methylase [Limosilactobacillus equigenerosi]|uniref:N-6 DNA methylase n=1 Tax=Limosilactobacillus equigenerosi TaxID=417373 RepID=UPI0006D0ECC3
MKGVIVLVSATLEELFQQFDAGTQTLQTALNSSYLDAFLENAENLIDQGRVRVEDGVPNSEDQAVLAAMYQQVLARPTDAETMRQLVQLSMLKVTHQDQLPSNYQITPDTIGLLMAALATRILPVDRALQVLDLVVGSGNLLTTVMNQLQRATDQSVQGYGVDNDEMMLAVASVSTTLQKAAVDLYHQDAILDLSVPQVDLVVADLPVGYYPLDDNTEKYLTKAATGHSYVHHLLIEQAMNYLQPGGFGLFLVPQTLFQSAESQGLVRWIQSVAHLQGILNLPSDLFANEKAAKSILILQRQGGNAHQVGKVLLGSFPKLTDQSEFTRFMRQIDQWVATDLKQTK